MDRFQAMQTFVAIVEHGSLTAAARVLGRSLPTVVRTLASLEDTLGTRLLARTTRRIAITEEGRRYLERCRRILAELEEAEAELSDDRAEPAGHLTLTAPVLFGQMHVVPAVAGLMQHHRALQVDSLLLDRVVNLVDEGVDLAVRIAHLADSGLVARRIGHIRRVVCASPDYLQRAGRPRHPRDIPAFDSVLWRTQEGGGVWRLRDGDRTLAVQPAGRFTSNHVAGALEACVEGLGLGSFLSYQVDGYLREGRLELLLEAFEPPPTPVSLVHAYARLVPARVRAAVDWLAEALGARLA